MNKGNNNQGAQRIFISYAHADNQPFGVNNTKWVSKLVEDIRTALEMEIMNPLIITDHMFNKSGLLDKKIRDEVEQSSIFIPIVSKKYLKSEYCRDEREIFQNKYKSEYDSRIIIVEKDEITDGNPFGPHLRHPFWFKDNEKQRTRTLCSLTNAENERNEYFVKIGDLTISICERLNAIDQIENNNREMLYVYLAEPTDNSYDLYSEIKNHLKKKGCCVLTEMSYKSTYKSDPDLVEKELKKEIEKAKFFIQLIESNFCKSTQINYIDKYLIKQNELARYDRFEHQFLWLPQNVVKDTERTQIEESIDKSQKEYLIYDNIENLKNELNDALEPYFEKEQKKDDDFFSASPDQQGGLMLVSGNIPTSELQKRVELLKTGFKSINNCYIEYLDSSRSSFFFFNQSCLSENRKLQLFYYAGNNLIPLTLGKNLWKPHIQA